MGEPILLIGSFILGAVLAALAMRRLLPDWATVRQLETERAGLLAEYASEKRSAAEKLKLYEQAEHKLSDTFRALSSDALNLNNQAFLGLAKVTLEKLSEAQRADLQKREAVMKDVVTPVRESLEKVDAKIQLLEQARAGAYSTLSEQVKQLLETNISLRLETQGLASALKAPNVRGKWGELQLKRVIELAGMLPNCDFTEQMTVGGEGEKQRPDVVVHLPGGRQLVIDAKAPWDGYLAAVSAKNENDRAAAMREHVRMVRAHVTALSRKAYWEQFQPAPEMVVMFLAGEHLYSAALAEDPSLLEEAANARVVIATPTSLIAMLRAIAYGWRQESIAVNAREISELGRELHKRVSDMVVHLDSVGTHLKKSVEAYNKTIHSAETRVLVTTRKFETLGAASSNVEVESPTPIDTSPRLPSRREQQSLF